MWKHSSLALVVVLAAGCGSTDAVRPVIDAPVQPATPTTLAAALERLGDANAGSFHVSTSTVVCAPEPVPPCSLNDTRIVVDGSFTLEPASTSWEHRVTTDGAVTIVKSLTTAAGESFSWLSTPSAPSNCWIAVESPMEKLMTGSLMPAGLLILLASEADHGQPEDTGATERRAVAPAELVLPYLAAPSAGEAYRGESVPITVQLAPGGDPVGFTVTGSEVARVLARVDPRASTSASDLVIAAGRRSTFTLEHLGRDPHIAPPDDGDVERTDLWPSGSCIEK